MTQHSDMAWEPTTNEYNGYDMCERATRFFFNPYDTDPSDIGSDITCDIHPPIFVIIWRCLCDRSKNP